MKAQQDRKRTIPKVFTLKRHEEERAANKKFLVVRSSVYKIKKEIKVVVETADNICRYIAELKQIESSLANQRKVFRDERKSKNDILLQITIRKRLGVMRQIIQELKLQGPHKLLYGYR